MPSSVKERPIIFSTPMVKAILENRKTQTRRIIKPQPKENTIRMYAEETIDFSAKTDRWYAEYLDNGRQWTDSGTTTCPYGTIGDALWVRETFYECVNNNDRIHYAANRQPIQNTETRTYRKRPSIFMPRSASRITLEITDIRVQRLQEITEEDARAEGIAPLDEHKTNILTANEWSKERIASLYINQFKSLWDSINAKRAPWASNPWVWALTFKRVMP